MIEEAPGVRLEDDNKSDLSVTFDRIKNSMVTSQSVPLLKGSGDEASMQWMYIKDYQDFITLSI